MNMEQPRKKTLLRNTILGLFGAGALAATPAVFHKEELFSDRTLPGEPVADKQTEEGTAESVTVSIDSVEQAKFTKPPGT